jgi:hypothetical protein
MVMTDNYATRATVSKKGGVLLNSPKTLDNEVLVEEGKN